MKTCTAALFMLAALCAHGYAATGTGGGDLRFERPNMQPVLFSHDYHTKIKGVRCMACHIRMFEKTAGGYRMNPEKLNKRDFCQYCHNGMKGFDARSAKNCSRCHKK